MKTKKIISSIFIIIITIFVFSNVCFGITTSEVFMGSKMKDVSKAVTNMGGIDEGINVVVGLLQIAGTGISVIMVTVLGIKYLLAGVDEKADIKKQAVPIVIGAILLFGAVNLLGALEEFTSLNINK